MFLVEAGDISRGKPSVCKDPAKKIQARFGRDKRLFQAFAMNAKAWKVDGIKPGGEKNDVHGMIVSAFQIYPFGFGMAIPDHVLQKVNG